MQHKISTWSVKGSDSLTPALTFLSYTFILLLTIPFYIWANSTKNVAVWTVLPNQREGRKHFQEPVGKPWEKIKDEGKTDKDKQTTHQTFYVSHVALKVVHYTNCLIDKDSCNDERQAKAKSI